MPDATSCEERTSGIQERQLLAEPYSHEHLRSPHASGIFRWISTTSQLSRDEKTARRARAASSRHCRR